MPFATAHTVSLHGATGYLIDVEADVSPGQVATTLIGRPDASLNECKDRCKMAVLNSGLEWPSTRRLTVLLSPADLQKSGSHFDLAVAVATLAAQDDKIEQASLRGTVFIGELALNGGLRSTPGVLPMTLAAAEQGIERVVVPEPQAREARLVPGMEVLAMRSLAQVIAELKGKPVPGASPVPPFSGGSLLSWRGSERLDDLDFADLFGVADAKFALEVAAAGGHAILLSGPKGAGKTSLAERVPTILPDLTADEALELTAIQSLAGALTDEFELLTRPPYSAPHHDASKTSLVGGGSGHVMPGEVSKSHNGVLFLDEFPLFRSDVINALREPLESGEITVARRSESVTLPARSLLVLACNPCPCGEYAVDPALNRCTCREQKRRDYRTKITGPVADRIDITRHVMPVRPIDRDPFAVIETSAQIRSRVDAARIRQRQRYAEEPWRLNSQLPGRVLSTDYAVHPDGVTLIDAETIAGRLTNRGRDRVKRLAWTLADLASVESGSDVWPGREQVEVALALRSGEPLLGQTLRRVG